MKRKPTPKNCDECGAQATVRYYEVTRYLPTVGWFCEEHAEAFERENAEQVARVAALAAAEEGR